MSKLITLIIIFYLIYRGSRWLSQNLKIHSDQQPPVRGGAQPDHKLPIDEQDIEDADFKDIK